MPAKCPDCRSPLDREDLNGSVVFLDRLAKGLLSYMAPTIMCPHCLLNYDPGLKRGKWIHLQEDLTLGGADYCLVHFKDKSQKLSILGRDTEQLGLLWIRDGVSLSNRSSILDFLGFNPIAGGSLSFIEADVVAKGVPPRDPVRRATDASLATAQIRKVLGDFSDSRLHVAPNIPYVMLKTAADKYAHGVTYPQALVLLDDCIMFGGDEGVCVTEDAVWWKITGTAGMIPIGQIRQVRSKAGGWIRPAKIFLNNNAISIFMGDKHRCADALSRIISYLVRATDKIHFQCPKCSKTVSVRKEFAGKRGKCPGCGDAIPIPSAPESLTEIG